MTKPTTRLSYGVAICLCLSNIACLPLYEELLQRKRSTIDTPKPPASPPNPLNAPIPEDPEALYDTAYTNIKAIKELQALYECRASFDCAQHSYSVHREGRYKDKAQCLSAHAAREPIDEKDAAGLKAGRLRYDERAASICFDWYSERLALRSCDFVKVEEPVAITVACHEILKGAVDVGGDCNGSSECQHHLKCSEWSCGGVCEPSNSCGLPGTFCEDGTYCHHGRCLPWVELDGNCANLQRCVSGSYSKRTPVGHSCTLMSTKAEGEACDEYQDCKGNLNCSEDKLCVQWEEERPAAGEGDPCTSQTDCQGGLSCQDIKDNNEGTCAPVLGQGKPCQDTHQCEYGLYCNVPQSQSIYIPGRCEPLRPDLASCTYSDTCLSGYCHSDDKCAQKPPECSDTQDSL